MVKTRKAKKNLLEKLKAMHDRIDRQQEEIAIVIERERAFRDRTISLIRGVRDGLREVNKDNLRFVIKIFTERLDRFIETETSNEIVIEIKQENESNE